MQAEVQTARDDVVMRAHRDVLHRRMLDIGADEEHALVHDRANFHVFR